MEDNQLFPQEQAQRRIAFIGALADKFDEVAEFDLQPQIDRSIRERDTGPFKNNLSQYGLLDAYDYLLELVRRSYPGWKLLFFHDVAHLIAKDTASDLLSGESSAAIPILPRVISEHVANLYQADVHPETVIGDANFIDHPHRGLTTGQTGSIGCGCVIYPCTLGGVTDKVKPRHPVVGNFIILGTDCGLFGVVKVGEEIEIVGIKETATTTCTGVEMFRKLLDQGEAGDNVGVLLRGTKREEVDRGQVLAHPKTINPHTHFEAEIYVLSKDEGGRHTPFFNGYRPQFYFRTTDVTGAVDLPEGVEMVMPGDNVQVTVKLIAPIAMEDGLRFAVREGGRTVGAGVVAKIIE